MSFSALSFISLTSHHIFFELTLCNQGLVQSEFNVPIDHQLYWITEAEEDGQKRPQRAIPPVDEEFRMSSSFSFSSKFFTCTKQYLVHNEIYKRQYLIR